MKHGHLLSYSDENAIYINFGTGFKTMLPQSSTAAYAQVVLPYIEKHVDTVTGLVVVLGFYVPPTVKVIRIWVQDWLKSLQYFVSLLYQLGRMCHLTRLSVYYQISRKLFSLFLPPKIRLLDFLRVQYKGLL